jgi:putative ABC transport system substrate-binding protein
MRGIRRREFITLLGGTAAWPLALIAQQPSLPVIGYVASGFAAPANVAAFRRGLAEAGIIEGRNATLEIRNASNRYELLPGLLTDLIARKAVVILASGAASAVAAKAATTSIPIVFAMGEDPVSLGLVQSLNRPGGNITGVAFLNSALVPKRLELLHEIVPQVSHAIRQTLKTRRRECSARSDPE